MTARPRLPLSTFKPPSAPKGFVRVALEPDAHDRRRIGVPKTRREQLANQESRAAGRVKMGHVRGAVWVDAGEQRNDFGQIVEVVPIDDETGCASDGD